MLYLQKYKRHFSIFLLVSTCGVVSAQQTVPAPYNSSTPINYVRTWDVLAPGANEDMTNLPTNVVRQATQYIDGLGRPIQTVIKGGSLITTTDNSSTANDMVSPVVYDAFGREAVKYLPFVANDKNGNTSITDGGFKLNPFEQQYVFYSDENAASPIFGQGETVYFGKTDFEPSPLNRPIKSYAPGESWIGNNVGNSVEYLTNIKDDDNVKIWLVDAFNSYRIDGIYKSGELSKTITTDEQGHRVVEYKDKEGKVLLKKVQVTDTAPSDGVGYDAWLSTYYVYDDLNLLRLVLPPKAVKILLENNWTGITESFTDMLCFKYEYDKWNRMIIKKVPGAAPVYMVYDKWDRLALTQDGNLRQLHKWIYTKYDFLNRPIYTGIIETTGTREQMQGEMDASTLSRFEIQQTGSGFQYTLNNSFPPLSSAPHLLTVTFYDNYDFTASLNTAFQQKDDTYDTKFFTNINTEPLYAQALTQSQLTKGMVTGKMVYQLKGGTPQYLTTVIFYDDKGRALQTVSDNISGGIDINTTQYNFAGQPLRNILRHEMLLDSGVQHNNTVTTTMEYDILNRLLQVKKKIRQQVPGHNYESPEKTIVRNSYNALGQLQSKELGYSKSEKDEESHVEILNYDYNIRGWLIGINKNYISDPGSHPAYFGMELAYDKNTAADVSITYDHPQLNGNIAGTIWRSKGDEINRKYDFKYDNVNRLLEANFIQKNADASWNHSRVDFSVIMGNGVDAGIHYDPSAYDENGNILRMQQWGLKINSSSKIDDLKYTYTNNGQSNQLQNVVDRVNITNTTLGDFRTSENHPQLAEKNNPATNPATITDYSYDVNGNLTQDENKDIQSITYNILNLPQTITLKNGKGSITYLYDATGNKLSKTTIDNTKLNRTITTTTKYITGFIYESKDVTVIGGDVPVEPELGYTDKLQFLGHEEGRIRYNGVTYDQARQGMEATFAFDYFVKDHLGNVRMVLTDEGKEDKYPAATLEDASIAAEKTFYSIPDDAGTRMQIASIPDYPEDNTTDPNKYIQKLKGDATKVGSSIVLKVMAGDKLNIKVSSWYKTVTTPDEPVNPFSDLLAALTGGVVTASAAGGHAITADQLSNTNALSPSLANFLDDPNQFNPDASRPKAYLNWILFDEQFNYVSSSSGAEQVPEESWYLNATSFARVYKHVKTDLPITKNGYLYVYVSNETPNIPVFFDNLQVTHYRGVIFDETHYYPFGLTMNGISSKAAGIVENKKKYNGIEFNNELDINTYEANLRDLDPQIGRWWQIDPKTDEMYMWSTYTSSFDNPIRYEDHLGDKPGGCCDGVVDMVDNLMLSVSGMLGTAMHNLSGGIVSNDPFNVRAGLTTSEKRSSYDNGGTVMNVAMILPIAGRIPNETPPPAVEFAPVGAARGNFKVEPFTPEAPVTSVNSTANSLPQAPAPGSVGGRSKNKMEPDKTADGDHSTFKRDNNGDVYKYQEWWKNERNPNGYDPGKRFDGGKPDGSPGVPHIDKTTGTPVPTPHINMPGGKVSLPNSAELPNNYRFIPYHF